MNTTLYASQRNSHLASEEVEEKMMKRKFSDDEVNFQEKIKEILVCKYCTFESTNIDELDNHVLSHEEENSGDIEDDFEDVIILVNEMTSKRRKVLDSYKCPHCKYETKRKHDLPKHLLTHCDPDSTTIYRCSQCPYETKRKNDMPKHMLAHCTDVQMFKCPECPYQTKRKSDLPKHLLCHKPSGEVPLYKCDYCEYVTKRKGDLPKHVLNHKDGANLELFSCSECDYKTKRKNDLHKHMLIHCDRHVAGVFKCLKCTYATDKVIKFSKHALSNCNYCYDAINMEHLMLDDIIGMVDEDSIVEDSVEEQGEDDNEKQVVYIEEQHLDEASSEVGENEQAETYAESLVETQYNGYKTNADLSKENYREAAMKKHGVFKINLGEFSYENNSQNVNQQDVKVEDVAEEDIN